MAGPSRRCRNALLIAALWLAAIAFFVLIILWKTYWAGPVRP